MIDRMGPRQRPTRSSIGTQAWRNLLFLHWIVDPAELRALVPVPLELDLWDGMAFVGLVPFDMCDVRSRYWPVPLVRDFGETNVRTYVVHQGQPGVYFLSLDASSLLAVLGARGGWGLPYYWASICRSWGADQAHYSLKRHGSIARLEVDYQLLPPNSAIAESAELADFLLERYLLFTRRRRFLYEGQVHHRPYPVRRAELLRLTEGLLAADGIDVRARPPDTVHWSPGVDVEIFPLRKVGKNIL